MIIQKARKENSLVQLHFIITHCFSISNCVKYSLTKFMLVVLTVLNLLMTAYKLNRK